jgi:apolipoprotein N-acyltransferase
MTSDGRPIDEATHGANASWVQGISLVGRWVASALATALLLALAEPPWDIWPLAGLALVPWLLRVGRSGSWIEALVGSLAVGVACAWASAPWGPEALRSLGAGPLTSIGGFLVGTLWVKGIPFAAVAALVYLTRHRSRALRITATSVSFFAVDGLHSTGSAGLPWALLGHSQAGALGVAQLAAVGGVPLLSGGLAAINQAGALAWEARGSFGSMRRLVPLVAAWGGLALLGLPLARQLHAMGAPPSNEPARGLLLVQPDIARGERWAENLPGSHLAKVAAETERALGAPGPRPDAILWPENLITAPLDRSPELAAKLQATVDRFDVPVVLGTVRSADGFGVERYRNSVLWIAPRRGTLAAIDKTRAFPLLEAGPASKGASLVAQAFGGAGRGKKVEEAARAGPLRGGFTLTVVLCYEALFPGIAAERRVPESVALVNLADDGWSHGAAATHQLMAFASFRAIEERLPLVRVAHGGLSMALDPFGQTLLRLPEDTWTYGRVEVRGGAPPGLAEKAGLLALPLVTGLGVWWALGGWSRRSLSSHATPPGGAPHA